MKWEAKTHNLLCPIDFETGEGDSAESIHIETVTLSTPKGKSMRKIMRCVSRVQDDPIKYSEGDMTMDCIQIMSDMPEGAVDELHPADINKLGDIAGPFLEAVMGGGPLSENSPDNTATTKTK